MVRRTKSSTSPMAWRCMNAVSAPWSHSGWRGPDTMTWSSTGSTWRDSNSSLHMNWSTCKGAGKTGWRGKERRKQWCSGEVEWWRKGYTFLFLWSAAGGSGVCLFSTDVLVVSLRSTSPPLPGPVSTVRSTCCSCELNSTHDFILALRFSFYVMLRIAHCQSVWMKEVDDCTDNMQYTWECVSVTHFCCLLTWSIVPNGDLWPVLEAFDDLRNSLLTNWTGPEVNQTLIQLISVWLWGRVWSHKL